jgi:N-acetylglucosamine transport system substrate-binding protein
MKKKKLISLVLAGTMVFGLAACGSNDGDKKSEEIQTVIR